MDWAWIYFYLINPLCLTTQQYVHIVLIVDCIADWITNTIFCIATKHPLFLVCLHPIVVHLYNPTHFERGYHFVTFAQLRVCTVYSEWGRIWCWAGYGVQCIYSLSQHVVKCKFIKLYIHGYCMCICPLSMEVFHLCSFIYKELQKEWHSDS